LYNYVRIYLLICIVILGRDIGRDKDETQRDKKHIKGMDSV